MNSSSVSERLGLLQSRAVLSVDNDENYFLGNSLQRSMDLLLIRTRPLKIYLLGAVFSNITLQGINTK